MILDDDDNDEFEEGDELGPTHISGSPPALPPKRNMRKPISHPKPNQQGHFSRSERIIPIVKEADGSIIVSNRVSHQDTPSNRHHGLFGEKENKSDKLLDDIMRSSTGVSEMEGSNDQSAASSSASGATSSSGIGTSTPGEQIHNTANGEISKSRYNDIAWCIDK